MIRKNSATTQYFVYILECSDKTFYTGITTDVNRRVEEHNNTSKGAKYTKMRRPVKLRHFETYKNRSLASKREIEIKKLTREDKMLILKNKK